MTAFTRPILTYLAWLFGTAGVIAGACLMVNCLVDPLWYLGGNLVTGINYPFNERLSKFNQLLRRPQDYDCLIMGSSRATLLPAEKFEGHRCFNLAVSDGQVTEYLMFAQYARMRGMRPSLLIVDTRREDFIGPTRVPDVPDFVRAGEAPASIFAAYLSVDVLALSLRTLSGDAPHHRYYDQNFDARLEVRPAEHRYNPSSPVMPAAPPFDVHPERTELYIQLRQLFPEARAIGYLPPESAWHIAAFSLTGGLDQYLAAIGRVAAAYDEFLDFAIPSPLTESREGTYDGSHYSETVNARIVTALLSNKADPGTDWHRENGATIAALYHERLQQFLAFANPMKMSSE
jgi:hypothetical protein